MRALRDKDQPRAARARGGIFFRLLSLMCLLVFLLLIYVVRHPLLRFAGGFWVVDDAPQHSDAIVMLSDDNFHADRAARAAELYRAGWAPRVIASGRRLRPYAGIAELEEHDLEDRGVPASAVVKLPGDDRNTREECSAIGALLASHGWKRLLLVTSNYHARRARYICSRTLPEGTLLRVSAASDSDYDPDTWWQSRIGAKRFFGEVAGMAVAMWELRHSSSKTSDSVLMLVDVALLSH